MEKEKNIISKIGAKIKFYAIKLREKIITRTYLFKPLECELLILDNFEPSPILTGFRVKEFNHFLNNSKDAKLLTFSDLTSSYSDWNKNIKNHNINWNTPMSKKRWKKQLSQYLECFSIDKEKFQFMLNRPYKAKGAYMMFIYNAYLTRKFLEKYKIPFAFTLFPGGGFRLNHPFSDHMMKEVFSSPMFKGCYCPQKAIYDYILEKGFCTEDKLFFSYGGGFFQFTKDDVLPKKYYPTQKNTIDICFVAYRYMKQGKDKGFDLVLEAAKRLIPKYAHVHFHSVGTHTLEDFDEDFSSIINNFHLYPSQQASFFAEFYSKMDIALSPNRPFVLDKGAFDGFPLAPEAAFCGSALFCSDDLNMNHNYEDGKELVVVKTDVEDVVAKIEHYINNVDELYELSAKGQKKVQEIFDIKHQISDRNNFIKKYLDIDIEMGN